MTLLILFNEDIVFNNGVCIQNMESDITLHSLSEGSVARVKCLNNEGCMRRRLQDIGLIPGAKVCCLQRSPSGDPIAYLIRGAVIALRSEDSSGVLVEISE